MLSTDRQTDKQTNATKNITSFAKEVKNSYLHLIWLCYRYYGVFTSLASYSIVAIYIAREVVW